MPFPIPEWIKVTGPELLEGLERGFEGLVPGRSGIYMWKLAVSSRLPFLSGRSMLDHIDSRCGSPMAKTEGHLGNFVEIQELTVAGKALPKSKRDLLQDRANPAMMHWMNSFLGSLEDFTPSLYVGETGQLDTRVAQHLNLDTNFGKKVDQEPALSWVDLDFHYCELEDTFGEGDVATQLRRSLEWVATMTSVSGYVERAG
jgi:hypothetical protein